jgi:ABC-type sugar transport system ATPase subunit
VRQYIRAVQRRLGVTTLYVTHDQTEAMTLGDRIVVMHHGRIQQVDTPVAMYERPANTFVAGFIGTPPMNLLPAHYADGVLRIADQQLRLSSPLRERLGSAPLKLSASGRRLSWLPKMVWTSLWRQPTPRRVRSSAARRLSARRSVPMRSRCGCLAW